MKAKILVKKIAFLLCLSMLITMIPFQFSAHAATGGVQERLTQLQREYPQGSYFSVNGKACSHTTYEKCGNCNLVNILAKKGESIPGQGPCYTCLGFATYVFFHVFGKGLNRYDYAHIISQGSLSSMQTFEPAKPGDVIFMYMSSTSGDREYKHEAIYIGRTSDGVILYDSNIGGRNKVHYGEVKLNNIASFYGNKTYCKIFRANNYDEIDALTVCDHSFKTKTSSNSSYSYAAVCDKCGYEFSIVEKAMQAVYTATESGRAMCSAPYQDAKTGRTITAGDDYVIVAYADNAYGNRWCKTSDNYWIYSEWLKFKNNSTATKNNETPNTSTILPSQTRSSDVQLLLSKGYPISASEVTTRIDAYNRIIDAYKTKNHVTKVYWNDKKTTNDLVNKVDAGDYEFGLSTLPCEATDRNKHRPSLGTCKSNFFYGATGGDAQCWGFADYMVYVIFGTKNKSDFTEITNISSVPGFTFQPGDVIRYNAGGVGHSGIVYKVSGDNMITLNCNLTSSTSNNCFITLNDDIKVSTIKSKLIAVYTPKSHLRSGGTGSSIIEDVGLITSISFNSLTTPGNLSAGEKGHIDGSITSNNSPIISVVAELRNASTGNVVKTASTSGFSLSTYGPINGSKLDKDLKIESLSAGTYYVRYTVKCKDGTQDSRDTSEFTVSSAISFTVSFDANGGYVNPTQKAVSLNNLNDSLPTPTRDGYTFLGWSTAREGSGMMPTSYAVLIPSDQTLYAKWKADPVDPPTSISFHSLTTPGNISVGNSGHIDGAIRTSRSPLISVKAEVYNASTDRIVLSTNTGGFSLSEYGPIRGSKLDNDLAFGSLSAGTYYIKYTATTADGTSKSATTDSFMVIAASVATPATTVTPPAPPQSTVITFNSLTTPGNLTIGSGGHIDGSINTSNSPIISVMAEVCDSSTGRAVMSASTSGFSLSTYGPIRGSKLDNDLTFGALPAGSYYIRYTATTADGTRSNDATSSFQIIAPATVPSTPSTSTNVVSFNSLTTPGDLKVGRGAHIDGSISSSGSPIVAVRAEVIDSDTGFSVLSAYTSGFSLPTYGPIRGSKLDNTLTFGSLSAGTYYIKYTVTLSGGATEVGTTSTFRVTN